MTASPSGSLTPPQFIAKWSRTDLSERSASQEHFLDLCRLLGQPTPAEHDGTGAEYTFEKTVSVTGAASAAARGQYGFADVWWKDRFGWEYKRKGKHASLDDAYRQLLQYREALDNPPLLVVCDIARIEIHTNFTGTAKRKHVIRLEDLADAASLDLLRRVFSDPYSFRPQRTLQQITQEVAADFAELARSIQQRGHDPHDTAHFLMKCMFCLFAEDVNLLPDQLFQQTLRHWQDQPAGLTPVLSDLFLKMKDGGAFGHVPIAHFNGGLFHDSPAIELTPSEIGTLLIAAARDWSAVDPSIFGTLFERSLDPAKRSQIGAHYTSRDDILLIVEPVVMQPLRRRWRQVQDEVRDLLEKREQRRHRKGARTPQWHDQQIEKRLADFMQQLGQLRILDPACGSGNFLYVAIQQLLDLEKQVIAFAARPEIAAPLFPNVRPTQLHGIEINPFAAELAQVSIWIGYLQWMRDNGFNFPRDPILEPLETIEKRDAILTFCDEHGQVVPPARYDDATLQHADAKVADWPAADFIIGNPPFLGSKLFRKFGLPDAYLAAMYDRYEIPASSDLCCYWFERARQVIADQPRDASPRVGLLATQGIRGGDNRRTLQRIKQTGDIFMAWADRKWILDGAAVHVSIIGFDDGSETDRCLDDAPVPQINANLSADVDLGLSARLEENLNIAFMGDTKGGAFDIDSQRARDLLAQPNPHGRPNVDVLRPWINGSDITRRNRAMWIIDFGCATTETEAAKYEQPFRHVEDQVKTARKKNRRAAYAEKWWIHVEPRPAMRKAIEPLNRFGATVRVAKHRVFSWFEWPTLPDSATFCFARSDDYFFGVLHSSIHELWARRMGTQLREAESGFRYTPTTCFETFPLPWPPGSEPADDPAHRRIADAAAALHDQRERWLNPPEWIDPVARTVDAFDDFADVEAVSGPEAKRLIRASAIMAAAAKDPRLKKRTLTNLYNDRPTWLRHAHEALDRAVLAAYARTDPAGAWDPEWAALWTETGVGQPLSENHPRADERQRTEQHILTQLLRLNQQRAAGP